MNVKKTKSSKKIVLKITMSMTLSFYTTMPAHCSSTGIRCPARTSTGNLPEGVEFNIHDHSHTHNSRQPYPSANNWYRWSNTDVPDDSFEDLGNVFAKLVFGFVWLTHLLGLHDLVNTGRRVS